MVALTIINDTHCGVVRSGGTTVKTSWALRLWVLERFQELLKGITTDLLILGDLLDTSSVPYMDLWRVCECLMEWLAENPGQRLYLVPGNHDLSKTTTTMSSFEFLAAFFGAHPSVTIMSEPGMVPGHEAYVIPHMVNQEMFNAAMEQVPSTKFLLLHCNYDNKFAMEADHSLNLSAEQARSAPVERIILAHEHQRSDHQAGKVLVIGNQILTSVADCIGSSAKYLLRLEDTKVEWVQVWEVKDSFERIDWHECMNAAPASQFIRIEGDAGTSETAAVVSTISKLRSVHNAFVVTNAVKIEGRSMEGEKITLEQVQSYNVLNALLRRLKPEQQRVVKELYEQSNPAE